MPDLFNKKVSPRILWLSLGLIAFSGGAGWAVGAFTGKDDFNARTYSRQRGPIIEAHMRDTRPGFILFAGDSHVELFQEPSDLCGRDTVNAGLSGANAEVYANAIERLNFPHKASLAILTIGTNDLLNKRTPSQETYKAQVERILSKLSRKADKVIASAIPPVGEERAKNFNLDAIESYSLALSDVCAKFSNCSYQDLYSSLRQPKSFGLARSGVMADGLHAKSYREIYRQLDVCNRLAVAQ